MDFKKKWGVDKNKVANGAWITIDDDGAKVLVARMNNTRYLSLVSQRTREKKAELKTTVLTEAEMEKIQNICFAEAVLLGWEGMTDEGKPVSYTPLNAAAMLSKYPDFHELVFALASNIDNFREETAKEVEKN